MRILMATVFLAGLCACSTPTVFSKTIEVRKDANGNVVGTTVTETMSQPSRSASKINLEYLGKKGQER